ncbi:hypothetical protein J5N97_022119 [Dioscorea zingiberensis]|uniref:Uncharacterized protein n=1 Tax=Dioscorea zingiberensis TaxID=325984 RepID=A0A9D5HAI7_9LILI|nr:hypothetical protein J5N97_022119 [Dioscorea zingiberensis]
MGCSASKVAAAAEAEADNQGDRPISQPIRRRIEEIRRRRQWRNRRKNSILSTTELLGADEEPDYDTHADGSLSSGDGGKGSHLGSAGSQDSIEVGAQPAEETKEEGEEKEEVIEVGERSPETKEEEVGLTKVSPETAGAKDEKREEEVRTGKVSPPETSGAAEEKVEGVREPSPETGGATEEEEVESPSFRIYFVQNAADSDESVNSSSKYQKKNDEKVKEDSDSSGTSTSPHSQAMQGNDMKSPKKEIGKRLKALTKAPSKVYCFLHCYNLNHVSSPASSATDHHSPRLLTGNAS